MCSFSIGKDQGLCERRENLQIVDTYSHSGQWNRSVTCSSKNLNLENNQSLLWEIRSSILHSVHIQNPQLLRQIPHLFGTRACQLLSRAFQRKAHVVYSYLRGYYCDEGCFLVPRTGYFVFIASASDGCSRRFIGGRWQSPAGARAADTQMILIWQLAKVSLAFATAHYVDRLILLLYSRARAVKHHNQQSQSSLIFRAADPPSNLECKEKWEF